MTQVKVEYPCGLKIELKTGFFETIDMEDGITCPLHGKKCSQSTGKASK